MDDKTVVFEVLAVVGHTQAKFRVWEELGPTPSTRMLCIRYSSSMEIGCYISVANGKSVVILVLQLVH